MVGQDSNPAVDISAFDQRFEILEEIGRGGMSVVYRGRDRNLQRDVALKILNLDLAMSASHIDRFRQEAHACSFLNHENIVQVLQYGIDKQGRPFMAMELLSGKTLEEIFAEKKKLNREEFRNIFMPVLNAMEYAHANNVIHRDLKPANIMVCNLANQTDRSGTINEQNSSQHTLVKVLDFGIAKILAPDKQSGLQAATLGLLGSPLYMSPEQIASDKVDFRTDIYSLACIMYESITGQAPFMGENALETMYRRLQDSVPRMQQISGSLNIPEELVDVLAKGLSREPGQRPQSMYEFRELIASALSSRKYLGKSKQVVYRLVSALLFIALPTLVFILFQAQQPMKEGQSPELPRERKQKLPKRAIAGIAILREGIELRNEKDFPAAAEKLEKAIQVLDKNDTKHLQEAYRYLAYVYGDLKDNEKSLKAYENCFALYKIGDVYSDNYLSDFANIAESLDKLGLVSEADSKFQECIAEADQKLNGDACEFLAAVQQRYGQFLYFHHKYKDALKVLGNCLNQCDRLPARRTTGYASTASWLIYQVHKTIHNKIDLSEVERTRRDLLNPEIPSSSSVAGVMIQFAGEAMQSGHYDLSREMYESARKSSIRARPDEAKMVVNQCENGLRNLAELEAKENQGKD